jgi:hypothetical protein
LSLCVQVLARKCYKGEKPSISFTLGQREEVESETILPLLSICELTATGVALMISESTATQFSSTIFVSAASQFSLSNCVVSSESAFAVELCRSQRICFCYRIVLSAANLLSPSNCVACSEPVLMLICVSCSEPVSLPNCVVCIELGFAAEWCCLQRRNFCCRITLSVTNQHSLPKLHFLQ